MTLANAVGGILMKPYISVIIRKLHQWTCILMPTVYHRGVGQKHSLESA